MGLKEWIVGHEAAGEMEQMKMGKLGAFGKAVWNFLDGWKTWIWAIVMALKAAFPQLPFWGYVDSIASAIGWNHLAPAIDPGQLVQWATFGVAIGHKLLKAIAQFRAGVPITQLNSPSIVGVPSAFGGVTLVDVKAK